MEPEVYRRKLPHIQPLLGTFFVTYRLHNSIPVHAKQQLLDKFQAEKARVIRLENHSIKIIDKLNRRYFGQFDSLLDLCAYCPAYLLDNGVAQIVTDSLHFWNDERIDLIAYCIMPNHVHAAFTLITETTKSGRANSLKPLMHSIKSYSAHEANKVLKVNGDFWEEETYDRLVRDSDDLRRIVRYILTNPVKAGLCCDWESWKWTYIKPEYDEFS